MTGRRSALLITAVVGAALGAALVLYLAAWPTGLQPVRWTPQPAPPVTGAWAASGGFADLELRLEGSGEGPEDIAVASDGRLYTGFADGRIVRFGAAGGPAELFVQIDGRPLGMKFSADGDLFVCDGHGGLLAIDPRGSVRVLTDTAEGTPLLFADDLDLAPDGAVWFSEASRRHLPGDSAVDALEGAATGRLLRYDPATGATTVHLRELRYANGVAVDPAGRFVLVSETFGYRIARLWLLGPRAGEIDLFASNLPGFVDNLNYDKAGRLWVAFVKPRSAILDWAGPRPWVRQVIARLPAAWLPVPPPVAFVAALGEEGEPLVAMYDPAAPYGDITSATPIGGQLWLGSLTHNSVGVVPLPEAL